MSKNDEKLVKINYFENIRSHHPKSIIYWVTEGIIIDDKRYPIEEFRLKDDGLYAVVSKNDREYFEVFLNTYDDTEILSQLKELNIRLTAEEQKVDKDTTYTAGNGLILSGTEFSIDDSKVATQQELEEIDIRLTAEEQKEDKDTTYKAGCLINISNDNTISAISPKFADDINSLDAYVYLNIMQDVGYFTQDNVDTLIDQIYYNSFGLNQLYDLENLRTLLQNSYNNGYIYFQVDQYGITPAWLEPVIYSEDTLSINVTISNISNTKPCYIPMCVKYPSYHEFLNAMFKYNNEPPVEPK